jgi:ABC-type nitrate/sulfonate/bicarbonate transport system permease component
MSQASLPKRSGVQRGVLLAADVPVRARHFYPILGIGMALGLWQAVSTLGVVPSTEIPAMSDTVARLIQDVADSGFWVMTGHTLAGWAAGLGIAVVLGIPSGLAVGISDLLDRAFRGTIEFLRPVPSVALVPLTILVLGTALSSQVLLASFAALWPVLLQTVYGVRHLDEVSLGTARSYRLPSRVVLWRIRVPGALPFIMTGIRISSAMSLILVVTAGLVIGSPGLGHGIDLAQQSGDYPGMYALILTTGLLGYGLNGAVVAAERRVLHWKYQASDA